MKYCKKSFNDTSEMQQFVDLCENEFENQLDAFVKSGLLDENFKFIILSGPTCSGKTTVAKKIKGELKNKNKKLFYVSIDDFFHEISAERNIDAEVDFESINAIDLELFKTFLSDISENRKTKVPRFDFLTRRRSFYVDVDPAQIDIFLFEGIQATYPEITSLLKRERSLSVYISTGEGITVGDKTFDPNEIRLMRRIVRDRFYRDSDAEYTFFLWKNVRKNEEENIFPNVKNCDIILNSTMGYEINMLSGYLRELLEAVPFDSIYRKESDELLEKIGGIEAMPKSLLPENSMYFEFLKR